MTDLFKAFSGEEYIGQQTSYPWVQIVSKDELERSGLFISCENANRAGFKPDNTWKPFSLTFKNSKEGRTEGFLCQNPRLLIVNRSNPVIYTFKKPSEYVKPYSKSAYDRSIHTLKTRHLLILVDRDNQPLHPNPIQLTTKGAFNGSFGAAITKYRESFNAVFTKQTGNTKPRSDKFFSMAVMDLQLAVEARGAESSDCCVIGGCVFPTQENIANLFVGTNSEMKALLESFHDSSKRFIADFEGGESSEDPEDRDMLNHPPVIQQGDTASQPAPAIVDRKSEVVALVNEYRLTGQKVITLIEDNFGKSATVNKMTDEEFDRLKELMKDLSSITTN
jgi:Family of unknown function (DUF5895)